jgi:toxin ParE1/3/4
MHYTVFMLQEAEYDLGSIFHYILGSGNPRAAKDMIRLIRKACDSLSQMPERGHVPPELARADNYEYRQIIFKPYRIIYQVVESNVFIFGIIHGRRNVDEVLRQRLSM